MNSKTTKNKLKFKYFLTKERDYLISDALHTVYHFIKNPHQGPDLFNIDVDIEEIYSKISNAPNIKEIYENYLLI